MPEAAALRLAGVNALYGESHVLRDVSFTLAPGRVLALLGRNGAGKTTCMNVVIGWLAPRSGDVQLFGEPITGLAPEAIARRGVGLVPQGRRVFPSLSVYENLLVAERKDARSSRDAPGGNDRTTKGRDEGQRSAPPALGEGRAEGRPSRWSIDAVFERFPELKRRERQLAGSLSGGEQQMLAIGRALVSNPRVLLLDEPSEGLAPRIVHDVGETLLALKARGFSIVLVEQNTTLALRVADDVAILNTGRIVFEGTVGEARARPDLLHTHLGIL